MESRPLSPEAKALAEELVKRYSAQCFWFWRPNARIDTSEMAVEVIRYLREYGGRPGWDDAARLCRCL